MKLVMLDDVYDWMFLRNDGKIFDREGHEVKWFPMEEEPVIEDNCGGKKAQHQSTEKKCENRKP